jgi:hypothetical protein
MQLAHGRLHQALAGFVEPAVLAHLGRSHVGIRQQPRALEALGLELPRCGHPLTDGV